MGMKPRAVTGEVILRPLTVGVFERVSAEMMHGATADCVPWDKDNKEMARRMTKHVLASHCSSVSLRCPSTPWQHFKERYAPMWLKRRYPVGYDQRDVQIEAVYPTIRLADVEHDVVYAVTHDGQGLDYRRRGLLEVIDRVLASDDPDTA